MTIMILYEKEVDIWMLSVRDPSRKPKRHSKGLSLRKLYPGNICGRVKHLEAGNSWETITTYRSEGQGEETVSWSHESALSIRVQKK